MTLEYVGDHVEAVGSGRLVDAVERTTGVKPPHDFLVIADTLTLVFARPSWTLCACDAYTNNARWQMLTITSLPRPAGTGEVCLAEGPMEDRFDLRVEPRYYFSATGGWLRIVLTDGVSSHYEVSDSLLVGISEGQLTDLYLRDLRLLD